MLVPSARAAAKSTKGKKKPASRAKTKAKAVAKARKRGKVFLERHVVALKNGLPNIQALGAVVLDLETGKELYARNPDRERPIASVSKLAAVLVIMDRNLELDELTTIAKGDAELARGGAPSRLREGMTLSNRDLLHAALMGSDNRAVPALGRAVGLSPSQLAAGMNKKVRELGLKHTRFREPTGLSIENVSTPRETIAMLGAVMKEPVLAAIVRKVEYEAHPVGRPPLKYVNTHKPAHRGGIQVLGGKTGYNNAARYCLVIVVKLDGHGYAMSFLADEGKLTRFGDVARVADWIRLHKAKPGAPASGRQDTAIAHAEQAKAATTPEASALAAPASGGDGTAPVPAAPSGGGDKL